VYSVSFSVKLRVLRGKILLGYFPYQGGIMSDDDEKKRPNANYKLSGENFRDDDIVFYYNREHRLAKAPQAVKDMYKEQPVQKFSLFRPLLSSKPLTLMFVSIVILSLVILAVSFMGLIGDSYVLEGNQLSIRAVKYEGTIIVAVDKTIKKTGMNRFFDSDPAYSGPVEIAVQPLSKAGEFFEADDIFLHRIFFTLESQEFYRFSVPFDKDELAIVFKSEKATLSLTVKAQ
jgi:hypothetical protein